MYFRKRTSEKFTSENGLLKIDFRKWNSENGLLKMDFRKWTSENGLLKMDFRKWTSEKYTTGVIYRIVFIGIQGVFP